MSQDGRGEPTDTRHEMKNNGTVFVLGGTRKTDRLVGAVIKKKRDISGVITGIWEESRKKNRGGGGPYTVKKIKGL